MILKDKRKRPLYIKDDKGEVYQSFYVKNGLHFCKGYKLILTSSVVAQSNNMEDLIWISNNY